MRLLFHREPVVSNGTDNVSYGDPFLASTSFAEIPGGAEFIANILQPRTVSISDGGRTVTIAAVPPPAPTPVRCGAAKPSGQPGPPRSACATLTALCHSGCGPWRLRNRVSPFAHIAGEERQFGLRSTPAKRTGCAGIPVVLTRIADNLLTWDQRAVSANTSHASLYIAHALLGQRPRRARVHCDGSARRRLARTSAVSCLGSWRSRPTSTDPAWLPRRSPLSVLPAACRYEARLPPCVPSTTSLWRQLR